MPRFRTLVFAAAALLALASPQSADAQLSSTAQWRGSRSERMIDRAVRYYGYNPNRLTREQSRAIEQTWSELLGPGPRRGTLTPTQATAIVYMALVFPHEEQAGGGYPDRPDYDDRPGGAHPPYWGRECVQMQAQAYELGNLASASETHTGLFVMEPEKGRARTLARQIQQNAIECRATAVADRADDVLTALSDHLPERSVVSRRVDALKQEIRDASPDRGGRY
ncbi:hypothetical protein [Longimicrobium sp.]|jgi:hypothetical protein|uniref:hypothetical protein n=1 Tax=Longimicrobium sp. TaxID=2029185 RepID=UPI002F939B4E